MQALLDKAEPLTEMIWRSETEGQSFDQPERRAKLNDSIRSVLGTIANPEIRTYYVEHFKDKRAALFAPAKTANPGNRPAGTWNGPQRPIAATTETRQSRLAIEGGYHARQVLEAEILRLAFGAPEGLETAGDSLSDVSFANQVLDLIRGRLISAYLDLSSTDAHLTSTALIEKTRQGMTPQGIERIDQIVRVLDESCTESALLAAVHRHSCIVAVESEQPDRDSNFAQSDDDVAYRRMLEARKAGEKARQSNLYPDEQNESVSVQDFIDQKIWIKTPGNRQH